MTSRFSYFDGSATTDPKDVNRLRVESLATRGIHIFQRLAEHIVVRHRVKRNDLAEVLVFETLFEFVVVDRLGLDDEVGILSLRYGHQSSSHFSARDISTASAYRSEANWSLWNRLIQQQRLHEPNRRRAERERAVVVTFERELVGPGFFGGGAEVAVLLVADEVC